VTTGKSAAASGTRAELDPRRGDGPALAAVGCSGRCRSRWWIAIAFLGPGVLAMIGENDGPSMISYAATGRVYGFGLFLPFILVTFAVAGVRTCCRIGGGYCAHEHSSPKTSAPARWPTAMSRCVVQGVIVVTVGVGVGWVVAAAWVVGLCGGARRVFLGVVV
jgi:hypothetical protein